MKTVTVTLLLLIILALSAAPVLAQTPQPLLKSALSDITHYVKSDRFSEEFLWTGVGVDLGSTVMGINRVPNVYEKNIVLNGLYTNHPYAGVTIVLALTTAGDIGIHYMAKNGHPTLAKGLRYLIGVEHWYAYGSNVHR